MEPSHNGEKNIRKDTPIEYILKPYKGAVQNQAFLRIYGEASDDHIIIKQPKTPRQKYIVIVLLIIIPFIIPKVVVFFPLSYGF